MEDTHIKKALEWVDNRIDTLIGDKRLVESETMERIVDHWIEDLEEVGKRLSTSAKICRKYHGRWSSRTRFCF